MCDGLRFVDLDGLVEISKGLLVLALTLMKNATIVERVKVPGVDFDGPVVGTQGLVNSPKRLFVSAAALHPDHGTSEATLEDAEVKVALADVAAEVIVAVDSSKLDHRAPARALGAEQVHTLVTELDPTDRRLDSYRDRWELL